MSEGWFAIGGAALGFLGGFGATWFNNFLSKRAASEQRRRLHLEQVYEELTRIKMTYFKFVGDVPKYVDGELKLGWGDQHLVSTARLHMLAEMYLPEIANDYDFVVIDEFIKAFRDEILYRLITPEAWPDDDPKELPGKAYEINQNIDELLSEIQQTIIAEVKK